MAGCVFCDIAAGKIPARRVREDALVVVFHDISPQAPVHVVVIPREHVQDLDVAKPEHEALLGHLLFAAREAAKELGLKRGYRVVVNCGPDGGQTVDHLHVHVLGGRALGWPPG